MSLFRSSDIRLSSPALSLLREFYNFVLCIYGPKSLDTNVLIDQNMMDMLLP